MFKIFVINPGSTSTKVAYFENVTEKYAETLHHSVDDLTRFPTVLSQLDFRLQTILTISDNNGFSLPEMDVFVGRGGLLKPIPGGTYLVDENMVQDLTIGVQGEHASNLGGLLANDLAKKYHKPAFIVDPVVVDELDDIARYSGHPLLPRKSIFHALNHKAVGRKVAEKLGNRYDQMNLIIVHLGGGISVAAHHYGKVIDVNNALDGEGPFTPERSGTLPAGDLCRLCFSGKYDKKTVGKMIKGNGGIVSYLGTNDMRVIQKRINEKDLQALLIYQAMAYQISKDICAMSAVLKGKVDAIALTGGIANDNDFVEWIKNRVDFLAPVYVFPGEKEMEALAMGALRILNGEETAKNYSTEAHKND